MGFASVRGDQHKQYSSMCLSGFSTSDTDTDTEFVEWGPDS